MNRRQQRTRRAPRKLSARARIAAPLAVPLAATLGAASAQTPQASPIASPVASPVSGDLQTALIGQITGGPDAFTNTAETWQVVGTDLGSSFMFHDEMVMVFGDTFGDYKQDWRSNVMGFSTDDDPADGITIDRMIEDTPGHAKELLAAKRVDFDEITVIPTYGHAIGERMFLHYMSVKHWGEPGHWELDHSGLAYSDDGGETWTKDERMQWPGDSNFGQVAFAEQAGFIHLFGIPGGRYGGVQLARVKPDDILDPDAYEYWNGSEMTSDISAAATIVPPNVGELSVRWNEHYQTWIMMYLNDPEGLIELRTADALTGPWSDPMIVCRGTDYPALYAPFMFPKWNDGPDIYFAMSMFGPYEVFLMKTRLGDTMS